MLTNEQIRVPKIKAAQLSALLILSRMFIILIFLPNTHHSVGGSVAILSIIVGFFLTFLVMIPLFFLLRQYPGMNLQQVAKQLSPGVGRFSAAAFYLVCIVVASETVAQFTLFLTSAVYPQASTFWIGIIFCASVLYLVFLGLEAISRMSVILLAATILSSLLVGLGLWRFVDTLNLISPLYEGIGTVLYSSSLYFTQNIELIAMTLLLSNLRTPSGKGVFLRYHSIVSIILVLVSFAAVTVLGSYGETRNFPIYTLFILSGSNVYYRFDYIVVAIWVAVSLVRAAVYLLLATRMLGELMGYRWGKWMMAVNGILVLLISTVSVRYIKLFQGIYQFLASGIPMYGLLVLLPLLLLFLRWRQDKNQNPKQLSEEEKA
ncbi:MAG: spore germination protein [Negativibacillus massiliensis]|nr:spore germination protein [Negativibacillus massiliensis]